MPDAKDVPNIDDLMAPLMRALKDLGGSGRVAEIARKVESILGVPDEIREVSHLGSTTQTELEYRLAWARTHLKKAGLITNSGHGVWVLTPDGASTKQISRDLIKNALAAARKKADSPDALDPENDLGWKDHLLELMRAMPPAAFERLCQRVLRESGFEEVSVTGKSGDGGIDGTGLVRLNGLISLPVVFQCKRFKESVSSSVVRDFRGAMAGKAQHGLILTTGRFTKQAEEEATRLGAAPIDLVDGEALSELLREHGIGVTKSEAVQVDIDWFAGLD